MEGSGGIQVVPNSFLILCLPLLCPWPVLQPEGAGEGDVHCLPENRVPHGAPGGRQVRLPQLLLLLQALPHQAQVSQAVPMVGQEPLQLSQTAPPPHHSPLLASSQSPPAHPAQQSKGLSAHLGPGHSYTLPGMEGEMFPLRAAPGEHGAEPEPPPRGLRAKLSSPGTPHFYSQQPPTASAGGRGLLALRVPSCMLSPLLSRCPQAPPVSPVSLPG